MVSIGSILGIIGYVILGVFLILFVKSMIFVVEQKTCAIVEVFGKFSKVYEAGLNFKLPYPFSSVSMVLSYQINQLKPIVTVKSIDNAFLSIPVKAQYRVIVSKAKEAAYELDDPEDQIGSYIINKLRTISSKYTMNDLFQGDNNFAQEIKEELNKKFTEYGYEIVDLLIDDPQPSDDLKKAFDEVLASERKKDAAQNLADALKIELIGQARAEKASLELKGEAFVTYRNTIAVGNKNALEIMRGRKIVTHKNEEYEELIVDEKDPTKLTKVIKNRVIDIYSENKDYKDDSNITDLDVLKFFEGVDHREALRSIGKNKGSVIISSSAPELGSGLDTSKIIGLIKSQMKQN